MRTLSLVAIGAALVGACVSPENDLTSTSAAVTGAGAARAAESPLPATPPVPTTNHPPTVVVRTIPDPPRAAAPPLDVVFNLCRSFDVDGPSEIAKFTFDFGGGSVQEGERCAAEHEYGRSGSVEVTVCAYDVIGYGACKTRVVDVGFPAPRSGDTEPSASPSPAPSPSPSICNPVLMPFPCCAFGSPPIACGDPRCPVPPPGQPPICLTCLVQDCR